MRQSHSANQGDATLGHAIDYTSRGFDRLSFPSDDGAGNGTPCFLVECVSYYQLSMETLYVRNADYFGLDTNDLSDPQDDQPRAG